MSLSLQLLALELTLISLCDQIIHSGLISMPYRASVLASINLEHRWEAKPLNVYDLKSMISDPGVDLILSLSIYI